MSEDEEGHAAVLRQLEEFVEANPDDPSGHFNLGVHLWEKGGDAKEIKERAAECFVLTAKLNPEHAPAFKYLGHYYARVAVNSQRATKCYQRAVSLDPNDSESGEAVCDLLDSGGKESLEIAVCREASDKSPKAFWAFRRLGYLQLYQNRWSEAVKSLQYAIRGYPTIADLWEALALAYQRLGMFTASIKSYGRAIELDATKTFALVECANIFLMLGSYKQGVEHFEQALKVSPQNISALYGLASALLAWSKECINLGAFSWATSFLEDACKVAKRFTSLVGNMSSAWKLHGDIQLTYARCFPWVEDVESLDFDIETVNNSLLSWKRICYSAARLARSSYQRALHLAPWQANVYTDIAIASDAVSSLDEKFEATSAWQLQEKMALGALLLEGDNCDFWVALGCLSHHNSLKQHAFIRALQLDVSLAVAWAYLGQFYREIDEKKLARQAFDCARSIDPTLALPWAGSADVHARESTADEAFESCLLAVQIYPLADLQIGLAKLAQLSGNLSSPQVFGAIKQAVQRAPDYPEALNLYGLVCEARASFHAAVASYRLARSITSVSPEPFPKSHSLDISMNLARSLLKAGNSSDAVQECESLKKAGMLDVGGLQIYVLSLWRIGKSELALSVATELTASVSTMEQAAKAPVISFICQLLYNILDLDSTITSIQKMPKEFFYSSETCFILSAIHTLDQKDRLQALVSSSRNCIRCREEITAMHCLIALGKLFRGGSQNCLGFRKGIAHLRKAIHMYPNSYLMRNLLGYFLLSTEEMENYPIACRCCVMDASAYINEEGLISALEVLGGGAVACNVIGNTAPKFSFPTCHCQRLNGCVSIRELQKCLHQEPWNGRCRYLLILNLLQKAREERFPHQLCVVLKRLVMMALSDSIYSSKDIPYQYQKLQLLLCASEITLQEGNVLACIDHASEASTLLLPDSYLFFTHLQLCRAHAIKGDVRKLKEEYQRCLQLKTDSHIGWIGLKLIEVQYKLETDMSTLDASFNESFRENKKSWKAWNAIYSFVEGLSSIWNQDLPAAEQFLAQACSLAVSDGCLLLCHGSICMELARRLNDSEFLSAATRSLRRAQVSSLVPLPIVSALLAQAEGSLGSKGKWMENLRLECLTWPPEMRPAELLFQMHVLARQITERQVSSSGVESSRSPEKWLLRAIHTNPSCPRYWSVLPKLMQME